MIKLAAKSSSLSPTASARLLQEAAAAVTPKPPPVSLLLTFLVARAMTKKTWLHGEDKPSCIILTALPAAAAVREKKAGEPSQCQMKK